MRKSAHDDDEKPRAWSTSWTAVESCSSKSAAAVERASGQKLALPKTGRSHWSRRHALAYARVDPEPEEHRVLATAETKSTKSFSAAPAPAGSVVHTEPMPLHSVP